MLQSEPAESELAQMAREEIARLEAEERRLGQEIQRGILPPDPADSRNTIFEIRAGAGGQESALFAADLYDVMMQRGKRKVYEDPEQFFALTFPTYNLRRLVREKVLDLPELGQRLVAFFHAEVAIGNSP